MTDSTRPPEGGLVQALAANRQMVAYNLLGLSAACLAIPIWNAIDKGWWAWPVSFWGLGLVLAFQFVGLWALLAEPDRAEVERDRMRTMLLTLGGLVGLFTALLGLVMPFAMYSKDFAGGLEEWRKNAGHIFICALALFGGLGLMFASLQLGRSAERTSPGLRRLLYGYNAVLTGFLVLTILALANLLTYVGWGPFRYFGKPWDWTASNLYSLSTATENTIKELPNKVKVTVLMREGDPVAAEAEQLLKNMAAVNPDKFAWEAVYRDFSMRRLQELVEKYQIPEALGMLVVYGTEPGEQWEFIRQEELADDQSERDPRTGQPIKYRIKFKGEGALARAINHLLEDKKKPVVYFTQGNGEPALAGAMGRRGEQASLGELQDRLTRMNYQVKPLELKAGEASVPRDASIVVVANPRNGLPESAVAALNAYMDPRDPKQTKGKLIVLADVVRAPDGKGMMMTGLEGLLEGYQVKLGNERLLNLRPDPVEILALPNPDSRNPIAAAFRIGDQLRLFALDDARPVEPMTPRGPGGRYKVDPLLYVYERFPFWKEADLSDPRALVAALRNPDRIDELRAKLARQDVSVAVAVVESGSKLPNVPGHEGLASSDDVPRLVVFGDATWITDGVLSKLKGDLFLSCLSWLRQRSDLGEIEGGSERKEYTLVEKVSPDMVSRLRWLPMVLITLTILALGGGIWVVRRR